MLKLIAHNIWIAQAPLLPFATLATMTVVKIGERLIIISPIKASEKLYQAIDALGEVDAIISPNGFHHLYFREFVERYKNATYYYSPAAQRKIVKRLNKKTTARPLDHVQAWWLNELWPFLIAGMPAVQEYVFYHTSSQTLVACDSWFFINKSSSLLARIFWWLAGIRPQMPGQSRYFRSRIKDKLTFKESVKKLLQLPIKRIVVAHENIIEGEALCKELIQKALR